jgi:hypothetical protein
MNDFTQSQAGTPQDSSTVTTPPVNPPTDLPALFKALSTALSDMDTALQPFDAPMSDADLRTTFYVSRGRDPYVEAGKLHLDAHGADYLAAKKLDAFNTAYTLKSGLEPIARRIDQLRQRVRIIQVSAGSTCYHSTSDFEKLTTEAGRRGDTVAREIAADLASKRPPAGRKVAADGSATSDAGTQATPKADVGAQTTLRTDEGV